MKTPRSSPRGRLVALIAAGIVLLLLTGVGIYGLIVGPKPTPAHEPPASSPPPATSPTPGPTGASRLPAVRPSNDPDEFTRNVAETLFAWDTASGFMPLDYTSVILAVGDPSGTEQAGLASDLAGYLPSRDAWIELRKYATSQHLTIERSFVPDAWADAVAQAQPGQIPPGTTAITIEGTRHRDGVWNKEPVSSEHDVAFTVFVTCRPPAPQFRTGLCHVLRLSQLDNPLR